MTSKNESIIMSLNLMLSFVITSGNGVKNMKKLIRLSVLLLAVASIVCLCTFAVNAEETTDNGTVNGVTYQVNGQYATVVGSDNQSETLTVLAQYGGVPVTEIASTAFNGNKQLKQIVLPDTILTIRSGAFGGCSSLTEVVIPDSVTTLENNSFTGMSSLKFIQINQTGVNRFSKAVSGYPMGLCVVLSDNVTKIPVEAFCYLENISKMFLSANLKLIDEYAFEQTNIKFITIPRSVTTIELEIFRFCHGRTEVIYCERPNSSGMSLDSRWNWLYWWFDTGNRWAPVHWGSEWHYDENQHWHVCPKCTEPVKQDHVMFNGRCVDCGHRAEEKMGFVEEQGITRFYYKDKTYATRWHMIDGRWYYFGAANGALNTEEYLKIAGVGYYFNADGSAREGLYNDEDGTRFYKKGVRQIGWIDTDNDGTEDAYFFSSTQLKCTETRKIGAYYCTYDAESGILSKYTGFLETEQGLRYYRKGIQQYGWITPDGEILNDRASVTVSGAYYFTYGNGKDHIAVTESEKTIGGLVRYFDENNLVLPYTGWTRDSSTGGEKYYVDGEFVTGWYDVDGNTYYFSRSEKAELFITYGDALRGWQKIGGSYYRFDSKGILFKGDSLELNGRIYYFNDDYTVVSGIYELPEGTRYYSETGVYLTGWLDTDGDGMKESYFYSSNGFKCREEGIYQDTKGQKRRYVYDSEKDTIVPYSGFYDDGVGVVFYIDGLQYTGWVTPDGKTVSVKSLFVEGAYFFSFNDGVNYYMITDDQRTIGGLVRVFDENHLVLPYTGWTTNETTGNINYYKEGVLVTGWFTLGENTYYLSGSDKPEISVTYGDALKGWQKIGGKYYRFDSNGVLFEGESLDMNGKVYYFNADHSVFSGFKEFDEGTRFYNEYGEYVTGWYDTDGNGARDTFFYSSTGFKCREDGVYTDPKGVKRFYKYDGATDSIAVYSGFHNDGIGTVFYIDGVQYSGWVTPEGVVVNKAALKIEGAYFFAFNDGVNFYMVTDFEKTVGGYKRVFDENHLVLAYTGWVTNTTTGNLNYYIEGEMQQGWCEIEEGYWVYLSTSHKQDKGITYGDALTGWQKIGGKVYYFRSYESTPKAGLITDAVKSLTYDGVRKEYQINQPTDAQNAKGADYYILNAPY